MRNPPWTYEETLLAFELYFKIPFGKICSTNKDIIKLAALLSTQTARTPASVSMKMGNLARLDPGEQARGIRGLSHGSKIEAQVWDDYEKLGYDLFDKTIELKKKLRGAMPEAPCDELDLGNLPHGYDVIRDVKTRKGQKFFRSAVLASYDSRCCITGINVEAFLTASHIKPWKYSDDKEKTNPRNGLCLNALHDRAFDQGYITINKNYEIVVSDTLKKLKSLDEVTKNFIISREGRQITVPRKFKPSMEFIEYHNDVIFKK